MTNTNGQSPFLSVFMYLNDTKEYKDELTYMNIDFEVKSNCDYEVLNIDISKIRRVFGNIIGNSIKNMKEDKYKDIIIKFASKYDIK